LLSWADLLLSRAKIRQRIWRVFVFLGFVVLHTAANCRAQQIPLSREVAGSSCPLPSFLLLILRQ